MPRDADARRVAEDVLDTSRATYEGRTIATVDLHDERFDVVIVRSGAVHEPSHDPAPKADPTLLHNDLSAEYFVLADLG